MKKFTIPCDFGGKKAPFDVYIGEPDEGNHPLQYQAHWLATERGGTIPNEVMESFAKLLALSKKNNVNFEDLCVYALEAANEEKKNKQNEKAKDLQDIMLKEKLKINGESESETTAQLENKLKALSDSIENETPSAITLNNRGFTYIKLEKFDLAISDLLQAIELKPNFADAYNNLGFAYLKLGEAKKALKYMSKSAQLDPNNSYVYRNIAHYYLSVGDKKQALIFLERAKDLNFHLRYGEEVNKLIKELNNKPS